MHIFHNLLVSGPVLSTWWLIMSIIVFIGIIGQTNRPAQVYKHFWLRLII